MKLKEFDKNNNFHKITNDLLKKNEIDIKTNCPLYDALLFRVRTEQNIKSKENRMNIVLISLNAFQLFCNIYLLNY